MKRSRLLWLVCLLVLGASRVEAATIAATDCTKAAINTAIAAATDGDTVTIPAKSCTINAAAITVSGKAITIQGLGQQYPTKAQCQAGGQTTYTCLLSNQPILDVATPASGGSPAGFFRVTNIGFIGTGISSCQAYSQGVVTVHGTSANFRFDHNTVDADNCTGVAVYGYVRGVVDHNRFMLRVYAEHSFTVVHDNWLSNASNCDASAFGVIGCGDQSWASPSGIGPTASANMMVVEDNLFQENGNAAFYATVEFFTDDFDGARAVYRRNTIQNGTLQTHGTETGGRHRGFREEEWYQNVFTVNGPVSGATLMSFRGGTGMVWDNQITTTGGAFVGTAHDFTTYRADDLWNDHPTAGYPWGRCGQKTISSITRGGTGNLTATASGISAPGHYSGSASYEVISGASPSAYNGTKVTAGPNSSTFTFPLASDPGANASGSITMVSPFDGNQDASGYPCLDQIGRGQGVLYSGNAPDFAPNISPIGPANQALQPMYVWNNLLNGALSPTVYNTSLSYHSAAIQANRDYYNQPSSGFNGSTGVGRGTKNEMLALSCTVGVAFWVTNEGEWDSTDGAGTPWAHAAGPDGRLYKCTATNVWSLYYTPLLYPHPLVGGGSIPTSPVVSILTPTVNPTSEQIGATMATLSGTASDDGTVTLVNVTLNGTTTAASGTTSWTKSNLALNVSAVNNISVDAVDNDGNHGQDSLVTLAVPTVSAAATDFNWPDWPTLGPYWSYPNGYNATTSNGEATGTQQHDVMPIWEATAVGNDQCSQITVRNVQDSVNWAGVTLRVSAPGGVVQGYAVWTDGVAGVGHTEFAVRTSGAWTPQTINTAFAAGDLLKACVTGTAFTVSKGTTTIFTATDTAIASGKPGMYFWGPNPSADNWTAVVGGGGPDTNPPTAPSNLVLTVASQTQMNLTWDPSTDDVGILSYTIERCTGASCTNFAQVGTATTTTFPDMGLAANTVYRYRVRAFDTSGNASPYSDIVSGSLDCGIQLGQNSQTFQADGGIGTVTVTTAGSCAWQALANDTWITIVGGSSGVGSGTITYVVAASTQTIDRQSTITVVGSAPSTGFALTQLITPNLVGPGALVRGQPILNDLVAPPLGVHNPGELGTIIAGPAVSDGYTWWQVDFQTAPDGWVTEPNISRVSTPSARQLVITQSPANLVATARFRWIRCRGGPC